MSLDHIFRDGVHDRMNELRPHLVSLPEVCSEYTGEYSLAITGLKSANKMVNCSDLG